MNQGLFKAVELFGNPFDNFNNPLFPRELFIIAIFMEAIFNRARFNSPLSVKSPSCLKKCGIIEYCNEWTNNLTEPAIPISTTFDEAVYGPECVLTLEKTRSEAEASGLLSRFNEEVSFLGCLDTRQRYVDVDFCQPAKSQVRWKTIVFLK